MRDALPDGASLSIASVSTRRSLLGRSSGGGSGLGKAGRSPARADMRVHICGVLRVHGQIGDAVLAIAKAF